MGDAMTDERLAEIRERWGNSWEYKAMGGGRPVNLTHALNDTADLLAEVDRLRGRNADLATRLDMAVHELEEHVAPEVARLRGQVETLQAELEICRGDRFGTDPAAWGQSMNEAWKRLGLPATEEGPTP